MASLLEKYGTWALITGASSGIGKEFAKTLAKKGFNLILVARREDVLNELKTEIQSNSNAQIEIRATNLANDGAVAALYHSVSKLDVGLVVPSAGIDEMGEFLDKSYTHLERMITLNVSVPTELAHYFGKKMASRKRSGIILVSSIFAYQGIPNFAVYAATKSYVLTLGEALHVEMKKIGVDVLTLSPGLTDTPFSQNMEINFNLIPMIPQKPDAVARTGLRSLGNSMSIVSGYLNKIYAWENRLLPRSWPVKLFGFLISNAIRAYKRKQLKAKQA